MRTLAHDLRFGFRMSLKSPGFTLVAVLTLAIGIACGTTVFSWIDTLLVRPIPGAANGPGCFLRKPDAQRRVHGQFLSRLPGPPRPPDTPRRHRHGKPDPLSIGEPDHAEQIWGELVTGNYFRSWAFAPPPADSSPPKSMATSRAVIR